METALLIVLMQFIVVFLIEVEPMVAPLEPVLLALKGVV
jgi:hypothetical protein